MVREASGNYVYYHETVSGSSDQLACYEDKYLVQAQDMDDVFTITNLWNAPDQVHTYSPGHSTSVGDIIVDNESGEQFMVADFGFNKLAA